MRNRLTGILVTVLPLAGWVGAPVAARAQADVIDEDTIEELVVYGRSRVLIGEAQSASEGIVGYDDIQLPPMLRVGELVEAVPGMVATQHSGTGKANQYFIRGFNLDHGTDFAVSVEGVPVNMRTHGHGQGYLDLNFIIPELVELTRYRRGPYSARVGDFSSAASVDFDLYDRLAESRLTLTGGQFGYLRGFGAGSVRVGEGILTAAADVTAYEGPWKLDEDLEQFRVLSTYATRLAGADAKLSFQAYESDWVSTDQVPQRAVRSGLIDFKGNLDDDLGGSTSRYAVSGSLDFGGWSVNAYAIDYDFTLYSNFTYFLDDPVNGDEFEQRDDRRIYGIGLTGGAEPSVFENLSFRWGADLRFDDIGEVALYRTTDRVRSDTVRRDAVEELSLGAWGEAEWSLTDRLRAVAGLRTDWYDWDVNAIRPVNSGRGDASIVSPKATIAWRVRDGIEAYLNWGRGFHSNDVRGATIGIDPATGDPADVVPALVRSRGAEIGLRLERDDRFNATVTLFQLDLDSELVFVGDAGGTEPTDSSERLGIETAVFWQATDWLAVNAAYASTDAEFSVEQEGGGREIPGAVESTFTLGLNAAWQNGFSASARLRWLGEAPLVEDDSVRHSDSLLVNAGVAWRRYNAEYRLDVFNLFDSTDNDIAYYYASRLPGEPRAGVEDIHFHPLEPRSLRATVAWYWR